MPGLLKMLTAMGFGMLAWVVASVFSGGLSIFGQNVSTSDWWESGAGFLCLPAALLMAGSAILMLCRSRYGRPAHIAGWVAINMAVFIGIKRIGIHSSMFIPAMSFNAALIVGISLYLYLSKSIRNYFLAVTD
ncbi:hypothetical protein DVJ77_14890 [Dyella tabacisoli]|uniref:Uncharacterized protein n=2 Tax=Dyella tabacisoli TaxID=2282381 RepID=A0A369UJP6_9GAMM|nr:hypothetical protein DVJ77_14890 [Dyella tabacisoli]